MSFSSNTSSGYSVEAQNPPGELFNIVSLQSSARPGCIIELEPIADAAQVRLKPLNITLYVNNRQFDSHMYVYMYLFLRIYNELLIIKTRNLKKKAIFEDNK